MNEEKVTERGGRRGRVKGEEKGDEGRESRGKRDMDRSRYIHARGEVRQESWRKEKRHRERGEREGDVGRKDKDEAIKIYAQLQYILQKKMTQDDSNTLKIIEIFQHTKQN